MRKLIVHDQPKAAPDVPMLTAEGSGIDLNSFHGRVVILNFWATWCAPCRKEMPSLDRLQDKYSPENLVVVALATGRNENAKVAAFLEDIGADGLTVLFDPRQNAAAAHLVRSIPVTLIIDRGGNEVARLIGDAEWDADPALRIIAAIADS